MWKIKRLGVIKMANGDNVDMFDIIQLHPVRTSSCSVLLLVQLKTEESDWQRACDKRKMGGT